jgi:predicted nuclease of predicted toxin-antitoxin system
VRFLCDENVDARLIPYLEALGHDVTRIGRDYPAGIADAVVLTVAQTEGRILITNDRDFGELIFRLRQPHTGVILFRLGTYIDLTIRIECLNRVLAQFPNGIDHFLVVGRNRIRIRTFP